MSRLYDALKGAGSSRTATEGGAGEVWDILANPGTNAPQVLDEADVADAQPDIAEAQTADVSVAQELDEVLVKGDLAPDGVDPANVALGVPVKVAVNEQARLIPNAIDPAVEEHYRRLRTKIMQQKEEKGFRSVLVASASPQEGKTLTVLNLGLSFATLPSFRVLVVDGDLRRGTLGKWLGADDALPGLSNLIDGSAELGDVVYKAEGIPMHFITRGNSPAQDLQWSQLQDHFQRMTEQYDLVLVDSPPVNLMADAQLLAANCEAVLLVVRAYSTTRKAYEKAVQDLGPFHLIGTVLNGGTAEGSHYHKYY